MMGRYLALDVGERRIGVAISDPSGTLARPLTTVVRASRQDDFRAISQLVNDHAVECIIVGLPLSLDGSEGPQALRTRRYAQRMAETLAISIQFWDERYSSATAVEILRGKKRGRGRRARGEIDAAAAAVILQSFLDSRLSAIDSVQ